MGVSFMVHEMRWGGVAGIAAVVCAILGRMILGPAPKITDSAGTIANYVSAHRAQIMTGSLLYAIAVVLVVWFGAALATAFRRADETSDLPTVVLAGFVLVAAIGFVTVAVFGGMTYALTAYPALLPLAAAPYTALTVVGTMAGIAVALPLGASAVAIAHTRVFPMWSAWLAGIAAAAGILTAFAAGISGGVLVPGGLLVAYVPAILVAVWVVAVSWLMVREHLPVPAAPRRHVVGHA
jgi:hypothetical protein